MAMMMTFPLILHLVLLLPVVWGGTDAQNYFSNPSSNTGINPVWTVGDQQVISWKTTLEVYNVSMWQQSLVQQSAASQYNVYSKLHRGPKSTNFTWTVQLYEFDFDYSNVFFFWINSDTPEGFISSFFNITKPESASTSHSTSASASTPTDSTNSVPSNEPRVSDTASKSASDSGFSTTAKIALGVGIGIGVPVLAALGALVWLRSRPPHVLHEDGVKDIPAYCELSIQQPKGVTRHSVLEMPGTDPASQIPELPTQRHH
ncbi:hypothetical protein P168DRAFT_346135 [Aspergillus campestris IBT 28561]|uniref:Mid2 domain-containing protein n=1 Tax=Aspergillus campestris (strain IBT 28561) TaxID=1392248 RepID=A0A2I1D0N7_ASPC2|nr:uncharacterized protein P168DRAFT_346135 [Aspergillus campestris IBT 28561]PKY03436.1 hypothetical protein P168DRAFT_346135 [Aspergillus campestris IBT 28561]